MTTTRENPFPTLDSYLRRFEKQCCWFCHYPFEKHETPHRNHGQRCCIECMSDPWCVYTHIATDNGFIMQVPDVDYKSWRDFIDLNEVQELFISKYVSKITLDALHHGHGVFLGDWEYHHILEAVKVWVEDKKEQIRAGAGTEAQLENVLAEDLGL